MVGCDMRIVEVKKLMFCCYLTIYGHYIRMSALNKEFIIM